MMWYWENAVRFRVEREAIEALTAKSPWLVPGSWRIDNTLRVVWDCQIVIGEEKFPLTLQYPNHFPHSPPLVLPQDGETRLSAHQYGDGGELCLEWRPDNWHLSLTGADMIESAHRLLGGERPAPGVRGRVQSAHATTIGQDLRGDRVRLVVTRDLAALFERIDETAVWTGTFVYSFHKEVALCVVPSAKSGSGETWTDAHIPVNLVNEGLERPAFLLRWPEAADLPSPRDASAFVDAMNARGINLENNAIVILIRGTKPHVFAYFGSDKSVSTFAVVPAARDARRLDDDHAALREKRAAIVGCGSLGGKIAVTLARAGVGRFLLIDDDILLPDNLVRHELDWREVGDHKADALARRINLVSPQVECDPRQYRLGGQHSSASFEALLKTISECDLIVDATAEPRVFNYLSAAVYVGKKPLMWAEIFGGGFGGLIARYRPAIEPDPASMRAIIEQWCHDQNLELPRPAGGYELRGEGPPMIADDADVSVIAAHTARLAIDTLIGRNPSMFPYSVYMIGLSSAWVFDQPFDTRPIDVGTAVQPAETVDPVLVEEEHQRVAELFQKFANEIDSSSSDPSASAA